MSIEDWRRKIDEIDRRLVELLTSARTAWSRSAASSNQPGRRFIQPEREKKVLDAAVRANPGPLPDAAIRRLFERILDEARSVERTVMKDGDKKS